MGEPAQAQPYMPTKAAVEDWTTPEEVLVPVRKVFGGSIDFDPCGNPMSIVRAKRQVWLPKWLGAKPATPPNLNALPPEIFRSPEAKEQLARMLDRAVNAPLILTREITLDVFVGDGLEVPWSGSTFVNPPYDAKTLAAFMARARAAAARGVPVIMLTKLKLTKGWHASVPAAPAVCFIDHRLTFGGGNGDSAPFDCALILWTQSRTLVNRFALEMECLGDVMHHVNGSW